jgi:hypothetical protein
VFSDNVDNFLSKINNHVDEENEWATEANALENATEALADDAKMYRDQAQASQNATEYSAVETYNHPDTVICTDGHAYRCLIDSTSGVNPIGDTTGHWQQITMGDTTEFDDQVNLQEFRSFAWALF